MFEAPADINEYVFVVLTCRIASGARWLCFTLHRPNCQWDANWWNGENWSDGGRYSVYDTGGAYLSW